MELCRGQSLLRLCSMMLRSKISALIRCWVFMKPNAWYFSFGDWIQAERTLCMFHRERMSLLNKYNLLTLCWFHYSSSGNWQSFLVAYLPSIRSWCRTSPGVTYSNLSILVLEHTIRPLVEYDVLHYSLSCPRRQLQPTHSNISIRLSFIQWYS